ncbi:MAG: hypothetical protein KF819_25945 [Labilithrix sp.]|nr:hypothetical protein [Labilithrix sp.]
MNALRLSFILLATLTAACGAKVLDVGSTGATGPSQGIPGGPAVKDDGAWFPESACVPVGPTPKVLFTEKYLSTRFLLPDGETLWFDGHDTADTTLGVNRVYRVPTAGGAATRVDVEGYHGGAFGFWDGKLAYVKRLYEGSGSGLDPRKEVVALLDRASGAETLIPNPGATTYVSGLRLHATGIYWVSREWRADKPQSISRWTPSGPIELTSIENASGTLTDGREIFYLRFERLDDGSHEIRIEAVPVDGGVPRVLRRMPYANTEHYGIVGVDGVELYFTIERTTQGGTIQDGDILAMPKSAVEGSGPERVVTKEQWFGYGVTMDPDHLSWVDQKDQATIVRVRRDGTGATERIEGPGPTRYVQTLAADRCNLYWSVVNPPAIYARTRVLP